jgi:hypothetical protein
MTKIANTSTPLSKVPSRLVWFAPDRENAPWTRVGALWPTKTGKGFRLNLELMPVAPGSLLIMPNEPRDEGGC